MGIGERTTSLVPSDTKQGPGPGTYNDDFNRTIAKINPYQAARGRNHPIINFNTFGASTRDQRDKL